MTISHAEPLFTWNAGGTDGFEGYFLPSKGRPAIYPTKIPPPSTQTPIEFQPCDFWLSTQIGGRVMKVSEISFHDLPSRTNITSGHPPLPHQNPPSMYTIAYRFCVSLRCANAAL